MDERDGSFLGRWSRLKRSQNAPVPPARPMPGEAGQAAVPPGADGEAREPSISDDASAQLPLAQIEQIDLAALDADSDYTPFMQANVPPALRSKALAQLWTSDPTLSQPDPFFEYGGDYTDAARAVAGGAIRTAYKVGQGFLSDEEAAEWDRLGKAPVEAAAPAAALDISIRSETPDQPEILAFFAASEAAMGALYPAESNHFVGLDLLTRPEVAFLVARSASSGRAIGCGALVPACDDSAEVKRMWVEPAARGRKVGRAILDRLEAIARERQFTVLRLETGVRQPEALSLYRSAGFVERDAFPPYQPDALSCFMEKPLG